MLGKSVGSMLLIVTVAAVILLMLIGIVRKVISSIAPPSDASTKFAEERAEAPLYRSMSKGRRRRAHQDPELKMLKWTCFGNACLAPKKNITT